MSSSSFSHLRVLSRATRIVVVALFVLVPAAPAAAQGHCAEWVGTLLDTTESCTNEPFRERAMDVEAFRWKGHEYLIMNEGNEFSIYQIDDPTVPYEVARSRFKFGTRGDSDYDLLLFDVCDDCRYGVLGHKVKRTVVFDLGVGAEPSFSASAYDDIPVPEELSVGGYVFSKGGQEYLIAADVPGDCVGGSGLYTLNGLGSYGLIGCMEIGGSPLLVRGLQTFIDDSGIVYLYAAAINGTVHIFRADGAGAALDLVYQSSPAGMFGRRSMLSIDADNRRAASADLTGRVVTTWSLADPAHPVLQHSIPATATIVSLRSPSANSASTLFMAMIGQPLSTRTFVVDDGTPEEFEADFWSDETLSHNDLPICGFDNSGALSDDGSVLFVSRNAVHQVFDLSDCLQPTPAVARLTVTPTEVYPGETVTIRDTSTGRIDRWAVWVADETGAVVAGTNVPSAVNPHEITFQIPTDVAWDASYRANVVVQSDDLTPLTPSSDVPIGIDRAPQVTIVAEPPTVVVGESVKLTATAGAPPLDSHAWTIDPPQSEPFTLTGTSTTVPLNETGLWNVDLAVTYDHLLADGSPYQATASIADFNVTSVAADFTISPATPLHNQEITLDGSISKPVGGNLSYAWQVERGLFDSYDGCGAAAQCVIPADSLIPDSTYTVTLTVTNLADSETSSITRSLLVGNGNVQPAISFSPSDPEIGQNIVFTVSGVPGDIEEASWSMGGPGCDGADSTPVCTPSLWNDCKAQAYKYASAGTKTVSLTVKVGGVNFTAPSTTVPVAASGSCTATGGGGGGGGGPVCTYSLDPVNATIGANGGDRTFRVITQTGCAWTSSSPYPWITILTSTGLRTGSGTVKYRVAENTGPQRIGYMYAGKKNFQVIQDAPYVPANFTMSNTRPEIGETVTLAVDPLLDVESWDFGEPDCRGNNPSISCRYLPSGTCNTMQWSFPSSGEKTITLTLTDDRVKVKHPIVSNKGECCLADGRPDASFTMTHAITNVSGEAVIVPVVDEVYAGEEVIFADTSSKSGHHAKALGITWSPTSPEIGENIIFTLTGVTGDIEKATWDLGDSGCDGPSTSVCTPNLWVDCKATSFSYASGGAKSVSVEVDLAGGGTASAGPVTVNIANAGVCGGGDGGCSYALSASSETFKFEGGSGSFDVNTTAECEWTATTTSSWLSIDSGGGAGAGTVNYSVAVNPSSGSRTGSIRVEGRTFRVIQAGDPGNIAPSEWRWTITRIADEDGEPVDQDFFTNTNQNTRFLFEEPGRYRISLLTTNCVGVDTAVDFITVTEPPVEDFVFGAAISMDGANHTHWESDFRFYNPCGEDLDVRIEYEPENTNNVGADLVFREFVLAPNESKIFGDITDAIPSLEGGAITGSVRIESTSASGCKVLSASRTYNETPEGSLGLFVPALPVKKIRQPYLDVTGLIQNADYRTNLRLVNHGEADAWVPITALQRNGDQVGQTRSVLVRGHSTKQINEVARWLGVDDNLAPFTIRAGVEGLKMHVLGTVVDNVTGDSVLYLPSFCDENRIWLAGVANLEGVNESLWRTDLWLSNPTETWLAGELEYVVGDSPGDVYGFAWPTLNTNRIKQYLDIVGDELGLEETRGYIVLTGADGGPVPQVAARTYNLDPLGGTYGLNLQAFASDDLLEPGDTGYVAGVSNSEDQTIGFRTNMGFLNTDRHGWTDLRITMYKLDGTLAADPYEFAIAPGKLLQFDIFRKFGLRKVTMTGSIKVEVLGGGAIAAYATEIDNRTQDSIFIPAIQKFQGEIPK